MNDGDEYELSTLSFSEKLTRPPEKNGYI
jgi:hypothetical protein